MNQKEIFSLIQKLRQNSLNKQEFLKLKKYLIYRSKIKGEIAEDVAIITLIKILTSKTQLTEKKINVFIKTKLIDAAYEAGIFRRNSLKVPSQFRIEILYMDII